MICPQCGFDMGMGHRCLRCGYEVKTLATVDEEKRKKAEEEETIVIDPRSTILTDEYGNSVDDDDDDDWFVDPISAIFEGLMGGDPFADLFDSLFGMGPRSHRKAARNKPQVEIPKEKEEEHKVVEVNKVEYIDDKANKKGKHNKKPKDDK